MFMIHVGALVHRDVAKTFRAGRRNLVSDTQHLLTIPLLLEAVKPVIYKNF